MKRRPKIVSHLMKIVREQRKLDPEKTLRKALKAFPAKKKPKRAAS